MTISAWLRELQLEEYAAAFAENKIDPELLRQLTDDDLKALGVGALGDRKRLLAAISALDTDGVAAGGEHASAARDKVQAPLGYTPTHLAERILSSRHALEGERKHVTMLFADIKGSTALIENLDPEEAAGHLNPALSAMMGAVHRYEGTVNRVQGDGIMALFGAPLAHEDHAVRACLAAIAIRDSFEGGLDVRVGLHCGEVLVRAVRNDLSMDYDVVGSSAHLASRMEQSAASGTIRITESVRSLAEGYVETQSLGSISVKGLRQKVEVHELVDFKEKEAESEEWRTSFERALFHYQRQAFDEAEAGFQKTIEQHGGADGPSKFYLDKIQQLRVDPPPPDWAGEVNVTEK